MAALPYQAYISTRLVGLISAAPSDIDWQLSLFSSFCCFHDHREGVSFQRSAAYQCAVDVRLREQFGGVGGINRTAVLKEQGLTPVLCIGETEAENEAGKTEEVCARQ
ncbi:hypothetical protein ACH57_04480, partial [Salmonella enterica subsp. enterica serovar Typhimurium]